jgi:hypothetical protein
MVVVSKQDKIVSPGLSLPHMVDFEKDWPQCLWEYRNRRGELVIYIIS